MIWAICCCVALAPSPESTPRLPADDWLTRPHLFYTIHYTPEDAAAMPGITALLGAFHEDFQRLSGLAAEDLTAGRVTIRLHPSTSATVQVGYASLRGGAAATPDGRVAYTGEIDLPGPTAHDGSAHSSSGHPMDRRYFDKLLVHEVSPIYLEVFARVNGGRFHSGNPSWFEQGAEEYFAVFHSTDYWRTTGRGFYERQLASAGGIDTDYGLNIVDPYNGGMMVVRFIAEEFGEPALLGMVASREPTFGRKLSAAADVPFAEFLTRFDAWRERTCGAQPGPR